MCTVVVFGGVFPLLIKSSFGDKKYGFVNNNKGSGGGGGVVLQHIKEIKAKKLKIEDFVPKSSVQFIFEIQSLLVTVSGTQLTKVTVRFHT